MSKTPQLNASITALHDIKEVSLRTIQFARLALVICMLIMPIRFYYGHNTAVITLAAFSLLLGLVIFMHQKGNIKYTKALTLIGCNFLLMFYTFIDGVNMGSFLYFFPLYFVLPFLIENHERFNREVTFYFAFTTICILVSLLFAQRTSPYQQMNPEEYDILFNINLTCAVILSASFAYLSIYFERKYAAALLQQQWRTEEAMKSRTQFLSHMGHELRTPLNGIIGATNLLSRQASLPTQEEYLNILKYCSNHMLDLINNILDFNKIEAGKLDIHLTEMNLRTLLENSVLPFHNRFEEKRISLRVELDRELDQSVMVDDIRLIQVINNLISNALKFTERGHVRLKVSCRHNSSERLEADFLVEDTGIGIKEEDQRKIFESFEQVYSESTRKYHGTGLGLTIAQRLLSLMDARLELRSEEGKGSRFSFSVSFTKKTGAQARAAVVSKGEAGGDLAGMRILIAEDNLINMLIATKMLEEWKVTFTTAQNGRVALEALEKDANYNMILMDLEMPEMDGYTAVREITRRYPDVPVLAFTAALVDNEMYTQLKYMGFVDAVLKPFQPMELFTKTRYYAN